MTEDFLTATTVVDAPPEAVFAVLADPAQHPAVDGTGWIRDTAGGDRLTASGQVFRMPMFHKDHPDGNYETANRVEVFDPPRAISWRTGYEDDRGELHFGDWTWRYDMSAGEDGTAITLTYDWSQTTQETRDRIGFPPFPPEHLARSVAHLAELVRAQSRR